MTDPIADMLNRIRNAKALGKKTVEVPFSRTKFEIGKILERTGFLEKVELKGKRMRKPIELTLKYDNKAPAISGMKRISKPGQRVYASLPQLKKRRMSQGIVILSTSKGLMTGGEAKKENTGGEILCEIW